MKEEIQAQVVARDSWEARAYLTFMSSKEEGDTNGYLSRTELQSKIMKRIAGRKMIFLHHHLFNKGSDCHGFNKISMGKVPNTVLGDPPATRTLVAGEMVAGAQVRLLTCRGSSTILNVNMWPQETILPVLRDVYGSRISQNSVRDFAHAYLYKQVQSDFG